MDEITFSIFYRNLNASIKSIKEAEKYLEDEPTEAKIKLLEKASKVGNLVNESKPIDIENEFSEAVLLAWDDAFFTKYNELKSLIDTLQWATVDVTQERNFLTEEDKVSEIYGVEGDLYNSENYKEALKNLEASVKKIDHKIKEVKNNFWGKIIGRAAYIVIGSIGLFSATITVYSKTIPLSSLPIVFVLETIGIYAVLISVVVGFIALSKIFFRINKKEKRKK